MHPKITVTYDNEAKMRINLSEIMVTHDKGLKRKCNDTSSAASVYNASAWAAADNISAGVVDYASAANTYGGRVREISTEEREKNNKQKTSFSQQMMQMLDHYCNTTIVTLKKLIAQQKKMHQIAKIT